MARGQFISFEGGEGTGKSTQIRRLAQSLADVDVTCIETREPGGSEFAEVIRELVLDPATPPHSALAEALLFSAARVDHLDKVIRPALEAGHWVLCDRFADSTRAYQGAAGGVADDILRQLEAIVMAGTQPDLTIILDLPVDQALARVNARREGRQVQDQAHDSFEARDPAYHEELRQGFLKIARSEPERCRIIDAAPAPEYVARAIWELTRERFAEDAKTWPDDQR